MGDLCDKFDHGRRAMIDAFVRLSDTARRAGIDEGDISAAHGQFFDGNVETKSAFGAVAILARIQESN